MKSFYFVVLILVAFSGTSFAASVSGFFNNPKNPGKCTIRDNLVLSPGDMIKDPDQACGRIMCMEHGLVLFHSCGVQKVEGCKMGGYVDKSLSYPDCCKRNVICN